MKDCQDVCNHLSFWTKVCFIENHEFAPVLFADPSIQVKTKSCQSIFVGNDKAADSSLHDSSQYGKHFRTFKIESASDFPDNFCSWVSAFKSFNLSFEVGLLGARTDSGVDDINTLGNKLSCIACNVVSSLSRRGFDSVDFSISFPST